MAKPGLQPGSMLDGFRIEELVHRGGMAVLWRVSREGGGHRRPTSRC